MQSVPSPAAKSVISSDFNTFLKMLTTQIKNQDPTNPMDSADFAVQLATFSGVEQQVKTNDMLATLSSQFGVMGMSQLAAWVGQEARAPSPVYLGNSDITLNYATEPTADRAVLAVRDGNGNVVAREDVPLRGTTYQWSGLDATGAALPNGVYSLSIENFRNGQQVGSPTNVEAYSPIQEARSGPTGTVLVLAGGIEVAATAVTALRVAETAHQGTTPPTTTPPTTTPPTTTPPVTPPPVTPPVSNTNQVSTPPAQLAPPQARSLFDTGFDAGRATTGGADDSAIFSQNPPVTLDEFAQPIPETYRPD